MTYNRDVWRYYSNYNGMTLFDTSSKVMVVSLLADGIFEECKPPLYGPDGKLAEITQGQFGLSCHKAFQKHAEKLLEHTAKQIAEQNKWNTLMQKARSKNV
jgi:hypothetical protein